MGVTFDFILGVKFDFTFYKVPQSCLSVPQVQSDLGSFKSLQDYEELYPWIVISNEMYIIEHK